MSDSSAPLAPALGKISSGLYVVTAVVGGFPVGMLCSFVEQASFAPPMVTLAIAPGRPLSPALEPGGYIGLHVLSKANQPLMKSFARGSSPESFASHELLPQEHGIPRFAEAWVFLACRVAGSLPAGDHRVYLAQVLEGTVQHEGAEPMIRTRANGFSY